MFKKALFIVLGIVVSSVLYSYEKNTESTKYEGDDLTSKVVLNRQSAYISPQCYTKTQDEKGNVFNPCYSCHINSKEPNYIDDFDLQASYDFSENSKKNPFLNSFKDRTNEVSKVSDEEILKYINQDNYKNNDGEIIIAKTLKNNLPLQWDYPYNNKKDGKWIGYIPDCYFNFDDEGFDKDNNGEFTGWRVFAYSPFLGTFWPTNGSTDDVMIRLPESMMQDEKGNFSKEVYKINFAIVESMVKQVNIELDFEVDEKKYNVDLNHNGKIDNTSVVVFKWNKPDSLSKYPKIIYKNYYVGKAKEDLSENKLHISPGLYPNGTEFLHSVRYIGIDEKNNSIKISSRMKELRYTKKMIWNNYTQLSNAANTESKEKDVFPDRLKQVRGNIETGLFSGIGWIYQGFIEDKKGNLRPQTYEETLSCVGCHSGTGTTTDGSFSFPRKFEGVNSWYHWSKKDLKGSKDRILPNGKGEYAFYLENNKAGDEFRANDEVKNKFFDAKGNLIQSEIEKIRNDITYLIYPSVKRAIELNKAYKVIVNEQSFAYGKDANIKPLDNSVYKEIEIGKSTGIKPIKF